MDSDFSINSLDRHTATGTCQPALNMRADPVFAAKDGWRGRRLNGKSGAMGETRAVERARSQASGSLSSTYRVKIICHRRIDRRRSCPCRRHHRRYTEDCRNRDQDSSRSHNRRTGKYRCHRRSRRCCPTQ